MMPQSSTVQAPSDSSRWLYFSDRPVGLEDDKLWKDNIASQQIIDIANQIIEPLHLERLSDAITFVIHGDWGSGKSSFLRMIQERAMLLAKEERKDDRIKFCQYVASSFINIQADIRTTLAMRVLAALVDGDSARALNMFQMASLGVPDDNDRGAPQPPNIQALRVGQELYSLAEHLAQLVDFPSFLSNELRGKGESDPKGVSKVIVVFIDDLDRCPMNIVSSILDATQQWGTVPNLFFVLAINQNVLLEAIRERSPELRSTTSDPDYALEKYVQHVFTVPDLSENRLRDYVQALLSRYQDKVSRAMSRNVVFLETGLRIKTPRAVKRALNTIRPDIQASLEEQGDLTEIEEQKIIKERVLQYSWREFYNRFFVPSVKLSNSRPSQRRAWRELEAACRAYVQEARNQDYDEEKLDFLIGRVKFIYRDDSFPALLPRDLARFLAQEPYWILEVFAEQAESNSLAASIPAKTDHAFDLEDVLKTQEVVDWDKRFMELYIADTGARDRRERDEMLRLALEIYKLTQEHFAHIPSHRADEIGNLAARVEAAKSYPFADALYQLALKMRPDHCHNMQNYVDFIVEKARTDRYDLALELLDKLESQACSDQRPIYTMRLRSRMSSVVNRPFSLTNNNKEVIISSVEESPSDNRIWAEAMELAGEVKDYELLRMITDISMKHADSTSYVYARIRGLSDTLLPFDRADVRDEGVELLRRLLEHRDWIDADQIPHTQHNYATALYTRDIDEEAGRLWYEAYSINPEPDNIRQVYAQYLAAAGRVDLASIVMAGQPLSEMVLKPSTKPMPSRFSDEVYIDQLFEIGERLAAAGPSVPLGSEQVQSDAEHDIDAYPDAALQELPREIREFFGSLPIPVRDALLTRNAQAFDAAIRQLPREQAQAVLLQLRNAGLIG